MDEIDSCYEADYSQYYAKRILTGKTPGEAYANQDHKADNDNADGAWSVGHKHGFIFPTL